MQGHEDSWSNSNTSSIPMTRKCQKRGIGTRGIPPFSGELRNEISEQSPWWYLAIAPRSPRWLNNTHFGSEAAIVRTV